MAKELIFSLSGAEYAAAPTKLEHYIELLNRYDQENAYIEK